MGCFSSKSSPGHEPTADRGCTDVCWLCIYVFFWILMIIVAVFSFVYGNPIRLINGYDSFGNTCGVRNNEKFSEIPLSGMNTADKPYVFFLDMRELRQTLKICVNKCPAREIGSKNDLWEEHQRRGNSLCRYDFNMSLLLQPEPREAQYNHLLGPCPPLPVFETTPVLHRCVPTGKNAPGKQVRDAYDLLNSWGTAQQLLSDLYTTWPLIVMICILALVLSIVMVAMLHWLTKIVSWIICLFVALSSIALTAILWWTYYSIKHKHEVETKYSLLEELLRNETAIYSLAIIATLVMIFLIMVIYFMRTQLGGLSALFEEAGKCMLSLPGLAGPPLLAFLALSIFLAFWVLVVICLATANYPGKNSLLPFAQLISHNESGVASVEKNHTSPDFKSLKVVEYLDADWLKRMLWLYLIGLIWTSEFIFACQQLTLAGAVAFWYFGKHKESPVLVAMSKLVKYHMGSVAKGAFLITIFKIPRLILTYLYAKLKRGQDDGSQCAACCVKCCVCCFWGLEKFIRYLNHNAYTVIAIERINFCPAAGIAWNAMMSNALQVATINGIGDFILFLGKLAVAGVCALVAILILKDSSEVSFYVAPVIFIAVFAFFIAHVVLSLYEIVVDTLFLCVCEDRTINGHNGRWKESNLAKLLGEEPIERQAVEERMQATEMTPITKEPFSSHNA
ncbi:choline transporter-like 1 [Phlebotomus argentipes]|uniref:choline transporter-like 1 n=1 Tax=Phlebotomus argentipes TaxID=94469 RepID=UPI002892B27C|nr:choline transporter-like 1 [Phlebotomus argentipes]